jgi:HK97 gp10 family phage protein
MPATLKSRFPQIIVSLDPRAEAAIGLGVQAIAAEAKARVPVESGALRDAIHVERDEDGWNIIAGDDEAFYGHIVEHGSVSTPPRPFLVPAAEAHKDSIAAAVTAALRAL